MTWPGLVWRNLFRHPMRTVLTMLSIALSIFLVCAVLSLPAALDTILEKAVSNVRISTHHEAGLTYFLPYAYLAKVRQVPHVTAVNHYTWFGGVYDEPKNMFPQFAVDPDTVGDMWPDMNIPPEQLAAFRKTRNGALVGEATMRKFGWRVGQNITLKNSAWGIDLTFRIVGVIRSITGNANIMWFQHKYLEESLPRRSGFALGGLPVVGMIWLRAEGPEHVDDIIRTVDEMFRNAEAVTASETEKSFVANFMSSFQSFIRVILIVGFLVVAAVVLIAANTASMGVRERIPEIAMLKSLGFGRRPILVALLAESTLLGLVGGVIGTLGAWWLFSALAAAGKTGTSGLLGPLGSFHMSPAILAQGLLIATVVGLVAGAVPAWTGARLNVVEALRRLA
jgi:putative ABC transport system permease protein